MFAIIGIDLFDCVDNFRQRAKREEAAAPAVNLAEAGFLNNHRPAGREITDTAIAKPPGLEPNVLVLGQEGGDQVGDVVGGELAQRDEGLQFVPQACATSAATTSGDWSD